jgi:hypothetical protein
MTKGNGVSLADLRNIFYGATLLTWAFAGLNSALGDSVPTGSFTAAAQLGAGFLVLALILELARRFLERDVWTRLFDAKPVKRGELAEIRELSLRFVPQVPSLAQVQSVFEAGRRCFWFVELTEKSRGSKKSRRVGFFSLLPLTAQAVALFERNSLDGLRLDRTHICGPRAKPAGLYIGGMGAAGFRARGWLVQHLRARIDHFFEDGGTVVFARPVTDDGLRIAQGIGFFPVVQDQQGLGNVYKLLTPF